MPTFHPFRMALGLLLAVTLGACGADRSQATEPRTAPTVEVVATPAVEITPVASAPTAAATAVAAPLTPIAALELASPAFPAGGTIPTIYTCKGDNLSPPLVWTGSPEGVQSYALILDDPDAGGFVHWVIYDLPATASQLPEGVPGNSSLPDGSRQGANNYFGEAFMESNFNGIGYDGPCPPVPHQYAFMLYALDARLDLPPRATALELREALRGHVLDEALLTGRFPA